MTTRALIVALASCVLLGSDARGQSSGGKSRLTPSVMAGVAQFDLSGTGTTPIIAGRVDYDATRWLLIEGSVGVLRPKEQSGVTTTYFIPEAQLQTQIPSGMLRPYIGAGGGYFMGTNGRGTRGMASVSGGIRANLGDSPAIARAELRVRGIGSSFSGSLAEWTLGLGWRF